jgi:hypothetical protein
VRLVWTYSKDWKKGRNISKYPHEYIQYLYKKSITSASNNFHKVIYTDEKNTDLFKDIVDEVIIRKPKPFIFLADLKFEVAGLLDGEMLITDGDIFFKKELKIPTGTQIGFEIEIGDVLSLIAGWKDILIVNGIEQTVPCWGIENRSAINLGLMYFNDNVIKDNLLAEYKKTQEFYVEHIEPVYKFNKDDKQFSACASQMLVKQFLLDQKINPYFFNKVNSNNLSYKHYASTAKGRFLQIYNK